MDIKKNIKEGKKSNIVGVIIILGGIISVYIPELQVDWQGASIPIGMGLTLIGLGNK